MNLNALILDGAGWYLSEAFAINSKGQIVGSGSLNGIERGFILTPVPEPSTLLALLWGLGAVVWRRRT
jgi:hypothetical protein